MCCDDTGGEVPGMQGPMLEGQGAWVRDTKVD